MLPTLLQMLMVGAFGYVFGSIPFGLFLTKAAGLGDIREIGSGNIGATNVLRTGNKKIAAATLLLDMLKGTVPVLIVAAMTDIVLLPLIAGLAAFIGHCFPVWLKFKGGKGIAVFFGIAFAWSWPVGLLGGLTWGAVAFLTRYSSLASLVTVVVCPLYFYLMGSSEASFMAMLLAVIAFWRHKENIDRLIKGKESKIGG